MVQIKLQEVDRLSLECLCYLVREMRQGGYKELVKGITAHWAILCLVAGSDGYKNLCLCKNLES